MVVMSDGDIVAGSGGGGIVRSTDGGMTWVRSDNGLSALYIRSLRVNSVGHAFAGTDGIEASVLWLGEGAFAQPGVLVPPSHPTTHRELFLTIQ